LPSSRLRRQVQAYDGTRAVRETHALPLPGRTRMAIAHMLHTRHVGNPVTFEAASPRERG